MSNYEILLTSWHKVRNLQDYKFDKNPGIVQL